MISSLAIVFAGFSLSAVKLHVRHPTQYGIFSPSQAIDASFAAFISMFAPWL